MTKAELMRRQHLQNALTGLGFTADEVAKLRKISNTLRRWFERECGTDDGAIERDDDGKPFFSNGRGRRWPVPDLERGARRRLKAIISARNARFTVADNAPMLFSYIQTDPRGAALYILRPSDVMAGCGPDAFYSRGICVY
jgi:hypothetical protein